MVTDTKGMNSSKRQNVLPMHQLSLEIFTKKRLHDVACIDLHKRTKGIPGLINSARSGHRELLWQPLQGFDACHRARSRRQWTWLRLQRGFDV